MKHFKTLLLVAVFTLGLGAVANAQKIGHIEVSKLLISMPATKAMETELAKTEKTYKDEIGTLEQKYVDKMKKYAAEEKGQTPETNSARKLEVQKDLNRIEQAKQFAAQEMRKKYNELLEPIVTAAQKAIKEVAAAQNLVYVFDASPGKGLLIFDKGINIYDAVKAKLGF